MSAKPAAGEPFSGVYARFIMRQETFFSEPVS